MENLAHWISLGVTWAFALVIFLHNRVLRRVIEDQRATIRAINQANSAAVQARNWALHGLELVLEWAGAERPEAEEPSHREQTSTGNQTEGVIHNLE